tara:strand:- start:32 stop:295 length:264 start_codon:yes stop_codon:yes gene_type:complete
MKRGEPGEAQAESLAERKAKWDAGAEERAASQARIQAAIDAHDAEEILRAGRSSKALCRIDKYVGTAYVTGEYTAWDCEAGDTEISR